MPSIATIISYCSNDFRFIDKCIEEAKIFSKQILIPVCDHFFDGGPENRRLLHHTYARHPECTFLEFPYLPDRLYSQYHNIGPQDTDWSMFWGTTSRYIGFLFLDPSIESVLFLDSDEICEGKAFLDWYTSKEHEPYEALRLAAYYYALRATLRAQKVVNLPLLVKKETFKPLTLFNEIDRAGAYMTHAGPKKERIVGLNGLPFVHHYSWVRTQEECLHKTRTWAHRHDEDWPTLIEKAFNGHTEEAMFGTSHTFSEIEESYFDPLQVRFPSTEARPPGSHVLRIAERDVRRKEIEYVL
ncbi:MAG: hypothetical protein KGR16_00185 [Verrucomicrobia bacterium]|nr:hypothetical protein [Verrucomicrobiota bacterium]